MGILPHRYPRSQGWHLHRLWTPHFFRDPNGCTESVLKDAAELLATEQEKDAMPVVRTGKR
jgi:hypothetical protein